MQLKENISFQKPRQFLVLLVIEQKKTLENRTQGSEI